jgi:hypothetical protein
VLNRLVFLFPTLKQAEEKFHFTIAFLFLLFFVFSNLILFLVKKVSEKSFDNTGMVFMMATFVKTGMVYFIIKPILNLTNNQIEHSTFKYKRSTLPAAVVCASASNACDK